MPPRRYILAEANYRQLLEYRPNVALLPWGATEAHNYHLPQGTDIIEAQVLAERAAALAHERGARPIALPTIPFGNNEQQLDQVATISITTDTARRLLADVARSLTRQSIDRLIVINAHGGNEFKPLVRDLQSATGVLVVVVNFWQMRPEVRQDIFDHPGDHADETETSILLHVCPELVRMDQAGDGRAEAPQLKHLSQPGVWTPRPWSKVHPDTGSGDPAGATADKGRRYLDALVQAIADVIVELSAAKKGDVPYI